MTLPKLRLMISSRSDRFSIPDGAGGMMTLREARERLKAGIEAEAFFGNGLVEVWINEREHGDTSDTAWNECLHQAEACDLFVALYDGDAGWAPPGSAVGICQAEFDTALRLAPGKMRIVRLPGANPAAGNLLDQSFHEALAAARRFETHVKKDWPELRAAIASLVREMVLGAALEGTREFRRSGGNLGQALDWSRMTFTERAAAIGLTIADATRRRGTASGTTRGTTSGDTRATVTLDGEAVLFACHGAPRSLSLAASREMVGQPFLRDHEILRAAASGVIGPIHIIGCPKGVTETQAVSLLGFPDFTVVEGSFGVYAADRVQRIQLCLLANCSDPGSTRNAVERFFEWLDRSRELPAMLDRAKSRRRIIDAILAG